MTRSIHNSTTEPLPVGGEFLGRPVQVDGYNSIIVNVHASAEGVLKVEQSVDGINYDYVDTEQINANTERVFNIDVRASEMRVRYSNGATGQFYFRLQTILSDIVNPNPALVDIKNEISTLAGTTSETYIMHCSILSNAGTGSAVQPGFSGSISTMIVQTTNTPFIRPLVSPVTFIVNSTSTENRASTSSGLYEVKVVGLDSNYIYQEEIVLVEGTGDVSTVNQYLHVNGLVAITGELVAGDIYVRSSFYNVRYAGILRYGVNNEYCNGWYMAQEGKRTYIKGFSGGGQTGSNPANLQLFKYAKGSDSKNIIYGIFGIKNDYASTLLGSPLELLPGESIYLFNPSSNVNFRMCIQLEIKNLSS